MKPKFMRWTTHIWNFHTECQHTHKCVMDNRLTIWKCLWALLRKEYINMLKGITWPLSLSLLFQSFRGIEEKKNFHVFSLLVPMKLFTNTLNSYFLRNYSAVGATTEHLKDRQWSCSHGTYILLERNSQEKQYIWWFHRVIAVKLM